jgi:hypothetical protein
MKPRVICQQCGLSLLDRHVLRRHVGFDDTVLYRLSLMIYTVYSGVPRESVFLLGTFDPGSGFFLLLDPDPGSGIGLFRIPDL